MPITLDTDDPNLRTVLNKIGEFENLNAGAHDRAILSLAGAALVLSLTFTHDLVPAAVARDQWALLIAWGGFVLTLAINVGGYILSLVNARAQIRLCYAIWRDKRQQPAALIDRAHRDEWRLYRLNVGQGAAFLVSMALLAFYVGDNTVNAPRAGVAVPTTQLLPARYQIIHLEAEGARVARLDTRTGAVVVCAGTPEMECGR
jgi:hypothetical protein